MLKMMRIVAFSILFSPLLCSFSEAQMTQHQLIGLLREAEGMIQEGDLEGAERKCRMVLNISGEMFPAYNLLGAIAIQEQELENAVFYFERSLEIQPEQLYLYQRLNFLYREAGHPEKILSILEKGIEHFPEDFTLNYNLGLLYLIDEGDTDKALEHFLRVRDTGEGGPKFQFLLGLSYVMSGQKEEALAQVTALRAIDNELLARRLEEIIRERDEDRSIREDGILPDRLDPPGTRSAPERIEKAPTGILSVGQPRTRVQASGEVTIRRSIQPRAE